MSVYSSFLSVSGQETEKAFWPAKGEPKAIVQLVHGMAEHIHRYEETAKQLNKAGFIVVGHTHVGHGEKAEQLGYFGKGGWDTLIEDVHALRKETQQQYPDLPYFLLGHSMGSFVVRGYCLKYEKGLAGVILSGTGHYDKPILFGGTLIANLQCIFGQARKPSHLLLDISSKDNLKTYDDVRTGFDWLSRDPEVVQKYMDDELCGFTFTASAYREMFRGLKRLYPEKLSPMEKDIPVLLISGDQDPVGGWGDGVKKVAQEIRNAGVTDVQTLMYADGRHEMFNELNKEHVWNDLIGWLEGKLN